MRLLIKLLIGLLLLIGALLVIGLFVLLLILLRQAFPLPSERPSRPQAEVLVTTPVAPYLYTEETVTVPVTPAPTGSSTDATVESIATTTVTLPIEKTLFEYVAVHDSCGPDYAGDCLNVRSGPGTDFPSIAKLRSGVVLKVSGKVENASSTWYKIVFDEWLRYPERVSRNWYVAAEHVEILYNEGDLNHDGTSTTTKRILVDRGEQKLYAYDGDELFMETSISTGNELTPTPRGTFTIYKKTPSRYMQGPLPYLAVSKYYDLPGVPWNMYFTEDGAVIHGAYWHNNFGRRHSSGCVNMRTSEARMLYGWADPGTTVTVSD